MTGSLLIWAAPIALVVAIAALVVSIVSSVRRSKRAPGEVAAAIREGDTEEALRLLLGKVAGTEAALERTHAEIDRLSARQATSVQHVGLVRFDALNEQTGELSFAMALLDDAKNGVVISSISGRQQTRLYGKALEGGRAPVALSDEEQEAIALAMRPR
jgi:hypothetical protein